jgi:hypothetical protein
VVWEDGAVLTSSDLARADEGALADLRGLVTAYARRTPVGRVAVVGNAPVDEDAPRAHRIDSADLVIRCNAFVLDRPGGPAFVGRRADVVVLNAATRISRSVFDGYSGRLYLRTQAGAVYRRRPSVPMPKVDLWPDDTGAYSLPNRALIAELRALLAAQTLPAAPPTVIVPTSGLVAAWVGYRLFPTAVITLSGFSSLLDDSQPTEWTHHGRAGFGAVPVAAAHVIGSEAAVMRSWVREGRAEHLP